MNVLSKMKFLRKKRVFAVLLLSFLLLLFYNTNLVGQWLYPIEYKADIQVSAENYRIDPFFIASIIRVETNYRPDQTSKKGAVGLMQIMPETANWIVERAGYSEETMRRLERPDVNIEVGAWYLQSLSQQFDEYFLYQSKVNQMTLIAAAYNAGPGNVQKWLESGTWDGKYETLDRVPFGETRHYVQRVVYYYNKYVKFYSGNLAAGESA